MLQEISTNFQLAYPILLVDSEWLDLSTYGMWCGVESKYQMIKFKWQSVDNFLRWQRINLNYNLNVAMYFLDEGRTDLPLNFILTQYQKFYYSIQAINKSMGNAHPDLPAYIRIAEMQQVAICDLMELFTIDVNLIKVEIDEAIEAAEKVIRILPEVIDGIEESAEVIIGDVQIFPTIGFEGMGHQLPNLLTDVLPEILEVSGEVSASLSLAMVEESLGLFAENLERFEENMELLEESSHFMGASERMIEVFSDVSGEVFSDMSGEVFSDIVGSPEVTKVVIEFMEWEVQTEGVERDPKPDWVFIENKLLAIHGYADIFIEHIKITQKGMMDQWAKEIFYPFYPAPNITNYLVWPEMGL